jgi:hypothetical protein
VQEALTQDFHPFGTVRRFRGGGSEDLGERVRSGTLWRGKGGAMVTVPSRDRTEILDEIRRYAQDRMPPEQQRLFLPPSLRRETSSPAAAGTAPTGPRSDGVFSVDTGRLRGEASWPGTG